MLALLRFLSLPLSVFLVNPDYTILAETYSYDTDYQLDEVTSDYEDSDDDLMFEFENLIDDSSIDDYVARQELLNNDTDNSPFLGASNISYILYARPAGVLGAQLNDFWNAVKAQKLKNPPVLNYPPHMTLTGFFTIENPGNLLQESRLITALQTAVASVPGAIPISIGNKIKQTSKLDYISIQSPVLRAIAVDFLDRAGLDSTLIRAANHITLRQDTSGSTTTKVRKLENTYIHLTDPHINSNTNWALFIYKRTGTKLDVLYRQAIATK